MTVYVVGDLSLKGNADYPCLKSLLVFAARFVFCLSWYHSFTEDNEMAPLLSRTFNLNTVNNYTKLS